MKKLSVLALAVMAVMLFSVPAAMATDVSFEGQYRVRGYYMENSILSDDDDCGADNAFMDQRFRLQTVFQVHEKLKLTTRFDALDNRLWGSDPSLSDKQSTGADINFDRAYLTAVFPWFSLGAGRMGAGVWGTPFIDYSYNAERLRIDTKVDNWSLGAIFQKHAEGDGAIPKGGSSPDYDEDYCPDCGDGFDVVDQDRDIYFLYFIYKGEGWDTGLLYGYDDNQNSSPNLDITSHNFVPYFRGAFGPIDLEAEAWIVTGEIDQRYGKTIDTDSWAGHLNVGFDVGPVDFGIDVAYTTGDDDPEDNDKDNFIRSGGMDWQPLLIMTGYYMDGNLGCLGNLNMRNVYTSTGSGLDANVLGYTLYYATADWAFAENMALDFALGYAEVNETDHLEWDTGARGIDDEFGWEFDIGFNWQLMDGLKYNAKAGYFWDGDFWENGDCDLDRDGTWSVLHALTLTF